MQLWAIYSNVADVSFKCFPKIKSTHRDANPLRLAFPTFRVL